MIEDITEECELCGNSATQFCECDACQEDFDDHGRSLGLVKDGRLLCDDCYCQYSTDRRAL